ncbi:hypothetical protein PINS_up012710 [Pythium insidiosum]|nr:hypothetical protein PINS_up012710 [Pythium insidiosum]
MPGLEDTIALTHHAGRIAVDGSTSNKIFYWHVAAATNAEKAPLVIWLNGGPGCSSMQGALLGISPFSIVDDTTIEVNKHSWHRHANLLFLDQPIGTGMSYVRGNEYRTDEKAVASDFHQFLIKFFQRHPEYVSESGFSDFITSQNARAKKADDLVIRLKGIGIGNGWVHPLIQYDYSDFAHGLGLVTFGQVRALKAEFSECRNALLSGKFLSPSCFQNMNSILDGVKNRQAVGSKVLNYYDVRDFLGDVGAYPSLRASVTSYLNQMTVREALHGNTDRSFRYRDCSDSVYDGLKAFDGVSTLETVERLLQQGLRVLFYNGQWDMMCNHYATEKLLLHLNWNGSDAYQSANKYTWSVPGRTEPGGFAQQGGNLTFIIIPGAGHMVPMDVPDVAAEMVARFLQSKPFDDSLQSVKSWQTNSSDLESPRCEAPTQMQRSKDSVDLSGLWAAIVVAALVSAVALCSAFMCKRGRKARRSQHAVVVQVSDDEDGDGVEQDLDLGLDAPDHADDSDDEPQTASIRSRS